MLDLMNASDEDILNASNPAAYLPVETDKSTETTDTPDTEDNTVENDDTTTDTNESEDGSDSTAAEDGDNPDQATEEDPDKDTSVPDAQAQLDLLFAPITANGKEMKIDNIDDVRRLVQMGLGFNKKMATLKPHLKLIKMLENNGLLDESKLSFLIDINKKDPKAIGKLLADSEIDPLNLTQGNDYTPNTYSVSDTELELNNTLDSIKESKHYGQLLDVVVNKWDGASKELLVSNPGVIEVLHSHMEQGIYDQVVVVMEKERALGRLTGLSDLEAYKIVGDNMNAKGLFKAPTPTQAKATSPTATVKTAASESDLKSRKLAASPTKSKPGKQNSLADFNPLTATDEEIANMTLDKFN